LYVGGLSAFEGEIASVAHDDAVGQVSTKERGGIKVGVFVIILERE
jgi:hypothetical protein